MQGRCPVLAGTGLVWGVTVPTNTASKVSRARYEHVHKDDNRKWMD